MVGNDIVDLNLARMAHRWPEQRFQKKIFSDHERVMISEAQDPFACLWRFWSMKESAYKIYKRASPTSLFSPIQYSCMPHSETSGAVFYHGKKYVIKTSISYSMVYSFSNDHGAPLLCNRYFIIPKTQERRAYISKAILNEIANYRQADSKALQIRKGNNNIPFIYEHDQKLNLSLTITHHGRYGAFAIASDQAIT